MRQRIANFVRGAGNAARAIGSRVRNFFTAGSTDTGTAGT